MPSADKGVIGKVIELRQKFRSHNSIALNLNRHVGCLSTTKPTSSLSLPLDHGMVRFLPLAADHFV